MKLQEVVSNYQVVQDTHLTIDDTSRNLYETTGEQRHWWPGKFSGLERLTQWNNEWNAMGSKKASAKTTFFFSFTCSICQRALPVHWETGLALGYLCCGASTIGSTAAPGVGWLWKCLPLSLCVLIDLVTILWGFSSQSLCLVCQLWLAYVQCLHHWCPCSIVATGVTPGNIWCSKSLQPFSRLWHHPIPHTIDVAST